MGKVSAGRLLGLTMMAGVMLGGSGRAQPVSVEQSGAKCDGVTDDTAALTAWLAGLSGGGLVYIPAHRQCLMASSDLVVPPNVVLTGSGLAGPYHESAREGSGLRLNPGYTIVMKANAALRDLTVRRAGLIENPTNAQVIEAVEHWGSEESHAVTIAGDGVRLEHLFIEGFNTAIYGFGWGTFIISDVAADTYNGLFITGAGDNDAILDTRFEPYYAIHSSKAKVGGQAKLSAAPTGPVLQFRNESLRDVQVGDYAAVLNGPHHGAIPTGTKVASINNVSGEVVLSQAPVGALSEGDVVSFGGSWARPGVSFYIQGNGGGTTGWYCERCFSFMYRQGAVIDGTGIGTMTDADFEYQHAFDPGTDGDGTFGVRIASGSAAVSINHLSVGGQSIPLVNDMAPSHWLHLSDISLGYPDLIITGGGPGPAGVAGAWFSGETGTPVILKLQGAPPANSQATLKVDDRAFQYSIKSGEGRGQILSAWDRALNSDPDLASRHIRSYWEGDSLTIFPPRGVTLKVGQELPDGLMTTQTNGAPSPGSWGEVVGFNYNGPSSVPAVIVGPNNLLPLLFSNFPGDHTGNVPKSSFAIDPTASGVQFLTWPAGAAASARLSSCGSRPSLLPGSTALRGTITEGAEATGCVLAFPQPFPRPPVCTIASPNGAPLGGYSVTTETLSVRNPRGSDYQYAYICVP